MASRDRASYLITAEDDSKRALDSAKRGLRGLSDQADHVRRGLRTLTAGLSVGAFAAFVKSGINAAEQLSVVSKRLGVSVEDLSVLKFAAEQSDTSFESLTAGLQRFEQNLAKAGISGAETISMLTALADRIQQTEDPAKRLQIAVQAFGRAAGPELVPFLAEGGAGIQALIDKAREMGLEISGETARAADEFNDKLGALKNQLSAVAVELGGGVVQGLGDFKGIMTDPEFLQSIHDIGEGIGGIVRALVDYKNEIVAVLGALAGFRVAGIPGAIVGGLAAGSGGSLIEEFKNRTADSPGNSTRTEFDGDMPIAGARTEFDGDVPMVPLSGGGASPAAAAETAPPSSDIDRLLSALGGGKKAGGKGRSGGAGAKRDEFAEALEGLKREIAMVGELTNAEKILYETQQGRYRTLTEVQKQALVGAAQQLDAATAAEAQERKAAQALDEMEASARDLLKPVDDLDAAFLEYNIQLEQLETLLDAGRLSQQEFAAATENLRVQFEETNFAEPIKQQSEEMVELMRESARDMQNAMSSLFFDIFQGRIDDLGARFKAFIDQMLADWLAGQIQMALFGKGFGDGGGLGGIFGSLFGSGGGGDLTIDGILAGAGGGGAPIIEAGFAKGAAFDAGNVIPFARGGVVNRSTVMPMAMMGEAGPEAILPLRRTADGNLGVMAGQDGGRQSPGGTVIHFHLPGVTNKAEFERSVGQSAKNAAALLNRSARRNG